LEGERAAFQPKARKEVIDYLLNEPESANIPPEDQLNQLEDGELHRLYLQTIAQQEQAEEEAQKEESQKPEGSELSAAGENEMTTPRMANPGAPGGNPQQGMTPADHKKDIEKAQNDTFTAAIDNEVAVSKKDSQKQKVRVARANATQSRARADVAEVRARAAEESRDSNIADILSKLDSNIGKLAVTGNPAINKVFVQLEATIDSIEKQRGEGGGGGNPFASLASHLSRQFKIMGQPSKKKKGEVVPSQTRSEIPEEAEKVQPMPESSTGSYDPHGATAAPPPSPTRKKFKGSSYQKSEFDKIFGRNKPQPQPPTKFGGSQYTDKPQKPKAPAMSPKATALGARDSAMASAQSDVDDAQSAMKAAGIIKALDGHINTL